MPLKKFSLKPRIRRKGAYSSVEPEERSAGLSLRAKKGAAAEDEDIGDVPRTVSAGGTPMTPGRGGGAEGREEDDSIGSPTEGFRKEASPLRGADAGSPGEAARHSALQRILAEEAR